MIVLDKDGTPTVADAAGQSLGGPSAAPQPPGPSAAQPSRTLSLVASAVIFLLGVAVLLFALVSRGNSCAASHLRPRAPEAQQEVEPTVAARRQSERHRRRSAKTTSACHSGITGQLPRRAPAARADVVGPSRVGPFELRRPRRGARRGPRPESASGCRPRGVLRRRDGRPTEPERQAPWVAEVGHREQREVEAPRAEVGQQRRELGGPHVHLDAHVASIAAMACATSPARSAARRPAARAAAAPRSAPRAAKQRAARGCRVEGYRGTSLGVGPVRRRQHTPGGGDRVSAEHRARSDPADRSPSRGPSDRGHPAERAVLAVQCRGR
jgi:hypothetical protein